MVKRWWMWWNVHLYLHFKAASVSYLQAFQQKASSLKIRVKKRQRSDSPCLWCRACDASLNNDNLWPIWEMRDSLRKQRGNRIKIHVLKSTKLRGQNESYPVHAQIPVRGGDRRERGVLLICAKCISAVSIASLALQWLSSLSQHWMLSICQMVTKYQQAGTVIELSTSGILNLRSIQSNPRGNYYERVWDCTRSTCRWRAPGLCDCGDRTKPPGERFRAEPSFRKFLICQPLIRKQTTQHILCNSVKSYLYGRLIDAVQWDDPSY